MKKKFKTKTKRQLKQKYKNIIIYMVAIIILILSLKYLSNLKISTTNISSIIKYSNNLEIHDIKNNIINVTNKIIQIDVNNPKTILINSIAYKQELATNVENKMKLIHELNEEENSFIAENSLQEAPLVYIYNTHPTEKYITNETENFSVAPDIKLAKYYLKEKLENLGIKTILNNNDVTEILNNNNWNYNHSYQASRMELEQIKNEYPSIKIFIDLHRDGLKREYSTTTIGDKSYAKVLFLVGKEHENYLENLEFTTDLNNRIKAKYSTLTRGVSEKEGPGVNGIYNQDIAYNVILLELGGNENTIEEATNTIDLIAPIIKEKIDEK